VVYLKNIVKNPNIIVGDYITMMISKTQKNFERNVHITLTSTVTSSLLASLLSVRRCKSYRTVVTIELTGFQTIHFRLRLGGVAAGRMA